MRWGPGRHGPGNNLFLFFDDSAGFHVELSSEMERYYDERACYTPRVWEVGPRATNLWGGPSAGWREAAGDRGGQAVVAEPAGGSR